MQQWPNFNIALKGMHWFTTYLVNILENNFLQIGYFREWKNALDKPLLKKLGLEFAFFSFRPVSNLPSIIKNNEKASVNQMSDHMKKRPLPSDQSAYKPSDQTP